MSNYTEKARDHFFRPRNAGRVESADGRGVMGDPSCGDVLEVTIALDERGVIREIGFLTLGCPGAIAASSAMTELAKGKSARAAFEITDDDVVAHLGGIPEGKRHCSLLGVRALRAAVTDALLKRRLLGDGTVKNAEEYERLKRAGRFRDVFSLLEGPSP